MDGTPRIALSLPSGEVRDLDPDEAQRVIGQYPEVRRAWIKWTRMTHSQGRLIVIDEALVARILADIDA